MSAATLERKVTTRTTRAALSTRSPIEAAASRARDSHDGPSKNVPVEMMPVAITNAKQPGSRSLIAEPARPKARVGPPASLVPIFGIFLPSDRDQRRAGEGKDVQQRRPSERWATARRIRL